jgi:hypothetical protein
MNQASRVTIKQSEQSLSPKADSLPREPARSSCLNWFMKLMGLKRLKILRNNSYISKFF